MRYIDSIDKIISKYISAVSVQEFEYKSRKYSPKPLKISPFLFRLLQCPPKCGACCPKFTLDYLPSSNSPEILNTRKIQFDDDEFSIESDLQLDNSESKCRHLNMESGRCGNYSHRPFSCKFETCRFLHYSDHTILTNKMYGRGWKMSKIDGTLGAMCEFSLDSRSIPIILSNILELKKWAEYFRIDHRCDRIMKVVSDGPHNNSIVIE